MRITPRKAEVQAVVELLESEGFDSAEDLAKAVIKKVVEHLSMRDYYAACVFWGEEDGRKVGMNFGPFASEAEAKKFAAKNPAFSHKGLAGKEGGAHIATIFSGENSLAELERRIGWPGLCLNCGCPARAHSSKTTTRGHCIPCGVKVCEKFRKGE